MTGAEAETAIQAALDASALDNVIVHLLRRDGYAFTATKGTPNYSYISSSTVKPITCAAILQAVADGKLQLTTRAVDVVPEFDALATNQQRLIELRHLLSFTSGLFTNQSPTPCASSSQSWGDFDLCVSRLATLNSGNDDFVPGTSHTYATDQHGLASAMVVRATGAADWAEYLTDWRTRSGMFPSMTWTNTPGSILGGNVLVMIRTDEYCDFFRSIFEQTILTPALCADLITDAIPSNPARTTTYTWLTSNGYTGEDWHFGRGIWLEQRNADWVASEGSTRFSSVGNAGQYAYFDHQSRVALCVSALFFADFMAGHAFARSIDSEVEAWGADVPAQVATSFAASQAHTSSVPGGGGTSVVPGTSHTVDLSRYN